ncbi:MAG: histidinol-phosphatase HisJ family protein, partial [Clostridia bacterium]|nr:histidinol-phosphatase HisJ family protein [Clostridia bacterium]
MIDTHTHSAFSHDGFHKISEVVSAAKEKGITYLAVTDHCDYDYLDLPGYGVVRQLDLQGYLNEIERVQRETVGIDFAVGLELGFHPKAVERYKKSIPFERFDYIINSVHSIDTHDVYFPAFFEGAERKESYGKYLLGVLASVSAPYPYSTVGHIGYISKNSVYDKKIVEYGDFADILDSILKGIIEKDKTLEINSNIRFDDSMPNVSVLKRYRELGGQNGTFGSDAHKLVRLGEGYEKIKEIALSLGFTYWTV